MINLGNLITDNEKCDAVHIAVAPITALEILIPGQPVALSVANPDFAIANATNPVGIVDPFLKEPVLPNQSFWIFLYPNTITSLRHEWIHPVFADRDLAKEWMLNFADNAELHYEELLEAARNYLENGEYICDGSKWDGFYTPDEFWDYYQTLTGEVVVDDKRGNFFTCVC